AFLIMFDLPVRILGCAALTLSASVGTGIPVALVMNHLRQKHGRLVAWMWGVSSAFNAIGAAAFIPMAQTWGISFMLLLVALLYALGALVVSSALNLENKQVTG